MRLGPPVDSSKRSHGKSRFSDAVANKIWAEAKSALRSALVRGHAHPGDQGIAVQPQDGLNASASVALVAAGQVPHQRLAPERPEHRDVAPEHFTLGQHAAQRIIEMRVGARLVQHQIGGGALRQGIGQPGLEMDAFRPSLLPGLKMLAHAVVDDAALQAQARDDVVGAVAVMHVAVKNGDALRPALVEQFDRRHHQAVEGAIALGFVIPGMVKAAGGRAGVGPVRQRPPGSRQQRAAGVGQGRRDLGVHVAKAVAPLQVQYIVHHLRVMHALEIRAAHGLEAFCVDDIEESLRPQVLHHLFGFVSRRRVGRRVAGDLFGAVEDFHDAPCVVKVSSRRPSPCAAVVCQCRLTWRLSSEGVGLISATHLPA